MRGNGDSGVTRIKRHDFSKDTESADLDLPYGYAVMAFSHMYLPVTASFFPRLDPMDISCIIICMNRRGKRRDNDPGRGRVLARDPGETGRWDGREVHRVVYSG
jgi:hypothetical protein